LEWEIPNDPRRGPGNVPGFKMSDIRLVYTKKGTPLPPYVDSFFFRFLEIASRI